MLLVIVSNLILTVSQSRYEDATYHIILLLFLIIFVIIITTTTMLKVREAKYRVTAKATLIKECCL